MIIFFFFIPQTHSIIYMSKCVLRNTILITCVHWIRIVHFFRHLNERKQKMKEKRRSSEEHTSFGFIKGAYKLSSHDLFIDLI